MKVVLLILIVVLTAAINIGMELVVSGVEDATSGESVSWLARLNLMKSSVGYIQDYWLVGSGLGTFGLLFPRYQSALFRDRWADYLHNDWLQLFCETGFMGGIILISGVVIFLVGVFRVVLSRNDTFCRWIATGALLGVFAILLHSLFDYNLYKITSNGIVFSVVLGLAFASANMAGSGKGSVSHAKYLTFQLGAPPLRFGAVALAIAAIAIWPLKTYASIAADIEFNRYLSNPGVPGKPHNYFFLSSGKRPPDYKSSIMPESGKAVPNARAFTLKQDTAVFLRREPGNHRYLYAAALESINNAQQLVRKQAVLSARSLVGSELEIKDPKGFDQITAVLETSLQPNMLDQRKPHLLKAESLLRQTIAAAPTVARYHTVRAYIMMELYSNAPKVLHSAKTAIFLAPNKPLIRYDIGRFLLAASNKVKSESESAKVSLAAQNNLREAISLDPTYTNRIYQIVRANMSGYEGLYSVTPRTIRNYKSLCDTLSASGDWNEVLTCLDVIEELVDSSIAENTVGPSKLSSPESSGTNSDHDLLWTMLGASKRRIEALGNLGRWEERKKEVSEYRLFLSRRVDHEIERARSIWQSGYRKEAMAKYLEILQKDWGNPEALLNAAEAAAFPNILDGLPKWNMPRDHLYRLVINNDKLTDSAYTRALGILENLSLHNPPETLKSEFIQGAGRL